MGLRERRMASRRMRIEKVTVQMCLDRGYDAVTVKEICARAEVSPSTFFNYFGSKDGAVLGPPPKPTPEAKEAFLRGTGPVLTDWNLLLLVSARQAIGDLDLFRARAALIARTPQLQAREVLNLEREEAALVDLVAQRMGSRGESEEEIRSRARMTVELSICLLRNVQQSVTGQTLEIDWLRYLTQKTALAASVLAETSVP